MRHKPWDTHAIRASPSANGDEPYVDTAIALPTVVRVTDTGESLRLCRPTGRRFPPIERQCDLRHIATSLLPKSHRLLKLGGQVSFAQQSDHSFFGTSVQSDHELRF